MKKITAIAVVLLFCVACSKTASPPSNFNKRGVSFSVPAGWRVTDEDLEGGGNYISVEKDGFDSSGLITMMWIPGELDLEEGDEIHKEELRASPLLKNSKPKFSPIQSSDFRGNQAMTATYTMSILGVAHTGQVWSFNKDDYYYLFVKQEADEDHAENKAGFEAVVESIKFGSK